MKTVEELATEAALKFDKKCPACGEDALWALDKELWKAGFEKAIELALTVVRNYAVGCDLPSDQLQYDAAFEIDQGIRKLK